PFAAIHALLRPALARVDDLPPALAEALRGALGLGEGRGGERFLVYTACLTLLSELAERRPVLCLIDDAQWLDTPSTDALLFVARRLGAEGVVMLMSAREGDPRRFDAPDVPSLRIGGLGPDASAALLDTVADGVAPAVREALLAQAEGNALALVELPAALRAPQLQGAEPLPEDLPLTERLEQAFVARIHRLPEGTQRLMLVAAADETGALAVVLPAAATLGAGADALDPAERDGLVTVRGTRLELRHPLVRSAVLQAASTRERRAAHLALADAMAGEDDADRRAWHLAAAALGPDEAIADALERSAESARARSGHGAASAALERAAVLSPDAPGRARRFAAAATAAWRAGRPQRATGLLARSDAAGDGSPRPEVEHLRGMIRFRCGDVLDGARTLRAAVPAAAETDTRAALDMLFDAANASIDGGDYAGVAEARAMAAALPPPADAESRFLATLLASVWGLVVGAADPAAVAEVVSGADAHEEPQWLVLAGIGAGAIGDRGREAELLDRAEVLARRSGRVDALALVLGFRAVDGVVGGRFAVADGVAEGVAMAQAAGLANFVSVDRAVQAWFAAVRGEDDASRRLAAEVVGPARANRMAIAVSIAEWAVALADLGAGRPEDAADRLASVCAPSPGEGHPYVALVAAADRVEALVRAGLAGEAPGALALLEGFAGAEGPPWARALAARCRGLLAPGDDDADALFAAALALHAADDRPFDRARTALLRGERLRRGRHRAGARDHLRAAAATFEALGAEPWAERARVELRATGETVARRDTGDAARLTRQELQVAGLVAQGFTNKEVAAQLFLSPRTIDAHLRGVFAKLGVTSRRHLRGMTFDGEVAEAAGSS
ncbi:MAG: LuxR C-terminal-related transcriptional regulator, partial [Thermoleophilia bacterium]